MSTCLLAVVGDLVEDVVVWLDGPVEHGTDTSAQIFRSLGGSAANVAMAADVPTRFIGSVGADPLGEALVAQLRGRGVEVVAQRGGRTGTVVVLVEPGGERTMAPDRAASAELDPPDADALEGVRVLHVPAYGLAGGRTAATIHGLLATAAHRGLAVTLDASSTSVLRGLGVDRFRHLVEQVRPCVLFANADEARLLCLVQSPVPGVTVLVKDGPRPTLVLADGSPAVRVAVPPVPDVRDSTGAGDAFAAGYLSAMLRGRGVEQCVAHAHATAATVLTHPGAGPR